MRECQDSRQQIDGRSISGKYAKIWKFGVANLALDHGHSEPRTWLQQSTRARYSSFHLTRSVVHVHARHIELTRRTNVVPQQRKGMITVPRIPVRLRILLAYALEIL